MNIPTLREQVADRCVHFKSPVHNKTCRAVVAYRALVGGPDFGWMARLPCFKDSPFRKDFSVTCEHMRFPNEGEIAAEVAEIEAMIDDALKRPGFGADEELTPGKIKRK